MEEKDKKSHEEELHLQKGSWFIDTAIGISDGLIVPFALAAGLSRVSDSTDIILTAGIATIIAGSVSMGIGGYFATRSEMGYGKNEWEQERMDAEHVPHTYTEVKSFFANLGLSEEMQQQAAEEVIKDKKKWSELMMKYGSGSGKTNSSQPVKSGLNIGASYAVGGIVALSPYLFISEPIEALKIAAILTLACLFVFGWVKGKLTGMNALGNALRMSVIGALAAGAAFLVARLFEA